MIRQLRNLGGEGMVAFDAAYPRPNKGCMMKNCASTVENLPYFRRTIILSIGKNYGGRREGRQEGC